MRIRILSEDDAPAWWQLRLEALETEPHAFGKAAEEHQVTPVETIAIRFSKASPDYFTLGAFESDSLIGTVTFVQEAGIKEKHKGRIYGFYVTPDQRGLGVGRALIGSLLEKAKENGSIEQILLAVTTCQETARQLYRHFGFETYGTEPRALKVGPKYLDEELMILRFGS